MAQDTKKGFVLYYDYRKHLTLLSDEERGKLLMALLDYGEHDTDPALEGAALMAFSFIAGQMDRDAEKYLETCRKRSEAGKHGGRPPKAKGLDDKAKEANAFSEKQSKAKKGDTDTVTDTDTETDIDQHPLPPKGGQRQQDPTPYSEIVELYHSICISYPKLRAVEGNRKRQIAGRWKKYRTIDAFRELFEKAEASDFMKGQNDKGWAADFDWLIRPTNMSKVLEGKYDNDRLKGGQSRAEHSGNTGRESTGGRPAAAETTLSGFTMAEG